MTESKTTYCLHKKHPDPVIEKIAEQIYLSRYGDEGGKWELVETPEYWWNEAKSRIDGAAP